MPAAARLRAEVRAPRGASAPAPRAARGLGPARCSSSSAAAAEQRQARGSPGNRFKRAPARAPRHFRAPPLLRRRGRAARSSPGPGPAPIAAYASLPARPATRAAAGTVAQEEEGWRVAGGSEGAERIQQAARAGAGLLRARARGPPPRSSRSWREAESFAGACALRVVLRSRAWRAGLGGSGGISRRAVFFRRKGPRWLPASP